MKDVVELDESDIIRILSMEIARERNWAQTGHTGVVTLSINPGANDERFCPGAVRVSARVEKVTEGIVVNGKLAPVADVR